MRLCVINSVLVVCFYNHLNNLQCAYDIFLLLMFSMRLCVINSVLVVCFYNHLNNLQCAYDIFLLLMFSMRLCVINSVLVVCFYNHLNKCRTIFLQNFVEKQYVMAINQNSAPHLKFTMLENWHHSRSFDRQSIYYN